MKIYSSKSFDIVLHNASYSYIKEYVNANNSKKTLKLRRYRSHGVNKLFSCKIRFVVNSRLPCYSYELSNYDAHLHMSSIN